MREPEVPTNSDQERDDSNILSHLCPSNLHCPLEAHGNSDAAASLRHSTSASTSARDTDTQTVNYPAGVHLQRAEYIAAVNLGRTFSAPAMVQFEKMQLTLPPAQMDSAWTNEAGYCAPLYADLRVLTWNIAAPNNNPFEFWASCGISGDVPGDDSGEDSFARLMSAVEVRISVKQ